MQQIVQYLALRSGLALGILFAPATWTSAFPVAMVSAEAETAVNEEPGGTEVDGSETPNYEDHIADILGDACTSCHRGSRAKNGLQLTSLAKMLEGGSSGPALVPGDAAGSLMFRLMMHEREPFMPEDEDKLEDAILERVREWINAGAPATATSGPSAGMALASGPVMNLESTGPFKTVAALPTGLRTEPLWWSPRGAAVMAVAASPSVDLVAIGGHKQISLYDPKDGRILGVLAFPEGDVESLRFSRSGTLLLAAGGRGGESGRVVGWEVTTGKRLFEIGEEPDAILSADLSSDQGLLALGGVDGILRIFSTADGQELHTIDQHTDWITAVAFSPDGVLLASADRAGGLFVREALSGREFHTLEGQKSAVNAIAWRVDSQVLASGANDGALRLFEMEEGKRVKAWTSHGGVLDLDFLPDGRLLSSGRDARARLWDSNGKELAHFEGAHQFASSCAASFDGELLLVGDMGGVVRVHEMGRVEALRTLQADPNTVLEAKAVSARGVFSEHERAAADLRKSLEAKGIEALAARQSFDALTQKSKELDQALANALTAHSTATTQAAEARSRRGPPEKRLDEVRKQHDELAAKCAAATEAASARREASKTAARERVSAERALQVAAEGEPREKAEEGLALARERYEGALALAQLAESEAADLALRETVARLQKELWGEITAPLIANANKCDKAESQADKDAKRLTAETAEARATLDPAASQASQLEAQLAEIKPALDAASIALEEARAEADAAEKAWLELKAIIETANGQVEISGE